MDGLTEIVLISGLANLHLGNVDQGLAEVRESLETLEVDFPAGSFITGHACYRLACVYLAQENLTEAQSLLSQAIDISREQDKLRCVMALATMSRALHGLGGRRGSLERAIEAVELVWHIRNVPVLLEVLPATAYLISQAASEQSVSEQWAGLERVYAIANRYGYIQSSYWIAGLHEQPIRTLTAVLPTDRVAAAEEIGRQLDLWATAASLKEELIIAAGHWL